MKHLLLTTIAAVLLVVCVGGGINSRSCLDGDIEAVKQHLAAGVDVNAKDVGGNTPLDMAIMENQTETADLLRKHGGKTKKELEAADN